MYKISIITATYNSGKTLEQTISSVIEQDYPNIEYIIIDGKSKDSTVDIIEKYKDKGIKYISEADSGIYEAFNKGVKMATGDYIQFLGSDDSLCSKNVISKVVANIDNDVDVLSAGVMIVDEKSGKQYSFDNHKAVDKTKYYGGMIPHPGMFVRASIFNRYKFDESYKITADYKFFLQCYFDDDIKFKFIDEMVVYFSNDGKCSDLEKCIEENNRIYKELGLPYKDSIIYSNFKIIEIIKFCLQKFGLLSFFIEIAWRIKYQLNSKFFWNNHQCNNKNCRWCRRE